MHCDIRKPDGRNSNQVHESMFISSWTVYIRPQNMENSAEDCTTHQHLILSLWFEYTWKIQEVRDTIQGRAALYVFCESQMNHGASTRYLPCVCRTAEVTAPRQRWQQCKNILQAACNFVTSPCVLCPRTSHWPLEGCWCFLASRCALSHRLGLWQDPHRWRLPPPQTRKL